MKFKVGQKVRIGDFEYKMLRELIDAMTPQEGIILSIENPKYLDQPIARVDLDGLHWNVSMSQLKHVIINEPEEE